jgi:hypothetical protein
VLFLTNTSVVTIFNGSISRSLSLRKLSCLARDACAAIALGFLFWANTAYAQSSYEDLPGPIFAPTPLLSLKSFGPISITLYFTGSTDSVGFAEGTANRVAKPLSD